MTLVLAACDPGGGRRGGAGSGNFTAGPVADDGGDGADGGDGVDDGGGDDGGNDDGDGAEDGGDGGNAKFDLGSMPDGGTNPDDCEDDDGDGECNCTIPAHVPCDDGTQDLFAAIGLNCPGELAVTATTDGAATGMGVRTGFGGTATFDPREGSAFAVIGSGLVAELDQETPEDDFASFPEFCSQDLGDFDPGALPEPLRANDVAGDCSSDATLVGTGDCSNTVAEQYDQGGSANDYTEMRVEVSVPPDVISFSYDFAFFSTEYPAYFGSTYNDMYIGWLQSEQWTGNISFDTEGNPVSLNAGFLDFKDDDATAPEFAGTCMRQHAGTNWLTTTAGVTPGEDITIVFAIFDLADSALDSYAFVDNFQWGCDPASKPTTKPEG
ncbi:MAG: choice-of-anchor L domain-containing protein [Myxococcota bacterium]